MLLKSDAFASNLSSPQPGADLASYCCSIGQEHHPTAIPVPLETFTGYARAFQRRWVASLEETRVAALDRGPDGYRLALEDGETFEARRVVLAIGLSHFDHLPEALRELPPALASHSSAHHDLTAFSGQSVAVIGGGASAVDLAALLKEQGAKPTLVVRGPSVRFFSPPQTTPPSLWRRLRRPASGIGPGLRSRFYADAPGVFRLLPAAVRLDIVRRHLGPASAWAMRARIEGAPVLLGHRVEGADTPGQRVRLRLRAANGAAVPLEVDHVIAATGYRTDLSRLRFLSDGLRSSIATLGGSPTLSARFESTAPGLHFVGAASAASFGPVMRFVFGADYASRVLSSHLAGGTHERAR